MCLFKKKKEKPLNKTLQEYLNSPTTGVYKNAKNWYGGLIAGEIYPASEEVEEAIENLPHEDEVCVNMRFKKELIRTSPEYAAFVSTLFDLVENYQRSKNNEQ